MSLLRRLLISVSLALLCILVGCLAFNLDAARSYLSEQLSKESENAATSLALSLSQPANQDPVAQELLMSALFDTGHFQAVRMLGPDGEVLFAREHSEQRANPLVPAWFARWMPLPTAQSDRAVSNGWNQLGTVQVRVDNRSAQTALWQGSFKMAMLILGAGGAWALFIGGLMRWFKRVLTQEITAQVQRIGTDDSVELVEAPQVRELRGVSSAIQHAHARVQHTEQVQLQRIESLELETNCDVVTQLPNRKYFLNELNKRLQNSQDAHGHVLLIRLRDLQLLNNMHTRAQVDAWVRDVTQQLAHELDQRCNQAGLLARLNGSDFAVALPELQSFEVMQEVQQLRKLLNAMSLPASEDQWARWAFALTPYAHGETVGDVLGRLDQGLMQAESAGHGEVEYVPPSAHYNSIAAAGEGQWQQVLRSALEADDQLALEVQPIETVSLAGKQLRFEATLELHQAGGKVLHASLFLPAAVRLGLMDEYDIKAASLGLQWLLQHPQQTLVVRVSLASIDHSDFVPRLLEVLTKPEYVHVLTRLVLELDARALEVSAESALQLCDAASGLGVRMGVRRLDESPKALLHIRSVALQYVKVGGFFTEQAANNPGAQHLVEAMLATALEQGASVYITDFVSSATAEWLRAKGASLLMMQP